MDLSSILSPGGGGGGGSSSGAPAPKTSQSSSPATQRHAPAQSYGPPPSSANGPPPPPFSRHTSQQGTPLYAPSSQDFRSPSAGGPRTGLTPLQTQGSQQPGQYPFPHNPSQSPVAGPGQQQQQHQQYPAHTATTPIARPSSHPFQRETPSQYVPSGVPQAFHQQHTSSQSPTPPSHHSHTPHSVRQSPLVSHHPHPQQMQYQHSQPSTPLGPPSLSYQRTSAHSSHPDTFSPYHQRNLSGASNGVMIGGSPAQHHHSIGHNVDSPSAYTRPSPHIRRTSDYLNQMDRERSVSVSPKTKVPPRVPSLGSRQSSMQESYSARSSVQPPVAQPYEAQNHVQQPGAGGHYGVAQPSFTHSASNVSQHSQSPAYANVSAQPALQTPLYQNAPPPSQPQHHQAQKMGMDHLLTPAHEQPPLHDLNEDMARTSRDPFMPPKARSDVPRPPQRQPEQGIPPVQETRADTLHQTPVRMESVSDGERFYQNRDQTNVPPHFSSQEIRPGSDVHMHMQQQEEAIPNPRKRPAEGLTDGPVPKREKKRKYSERPIWARLNPKNPKYDATSMQNGAPVQQQQQQQQQQQRQQQRQPKQATPQPAQIPPQHNGRPQANGHGDPAREALIDRDLERARQILGGWEKSFKGITPVPDIEKGVSDWLWVNLLKHKDIGLDAREGTIEIEAKIGTLLSANGGHDRVRIPVASMCLLPESDNSHYRFESQMQVQEHAMMNELLNRATAESRAPGREHIQYAHIFQTDTFDTLSPAGVAALPPSIHGRQPQGRDLRLRTSTDKTTGRVKDRIIKVNLANLHIYNPRGPYDCRISMNLEVNIQPRLDSGELHIEDLILPPPPNKPAPAPRIKDRMHYHHLAYDIDLTKVEGAQESYELELEVDTAVLREQMAKMGSGEGSAFPDVVRGFLENATFLMRETGAR